MTPIAPSPEPYALHVNGATHRVPTSWLGESLLHVLRERLGLGGTKNACDQGECGSCTVLLDGRAVCACCVMAADAVGAAVTTVEGLDADDVKQSFVAAGAVQCGFCTPGLIVATQDLLSRAPEADATTVREALSGNLCRCTGYGRILEAVAQVQARRRGQEAPSP